MSGPTGHSKFSASNFEADTLCPGRRTMQSGLPDHGSKYADEGTAAHSLLDDCLTTGLSPEAARDAGAVYPVNGKDWPVTTDMATAVQTAIDNIKEIVGDGMMLSEQRVNYSVYLGVPTDQAWGTSDVIAMRDSELQVHDYKHGMGVEVDADDNPQMKLYGLGALQDMRAMGEEPKTVRLVIHQPRIKSAPSEWTCTVEELEAWGNGEARRAAEEQLGAERLSGGEAWDEAMWQEIYLRPNEKSCKFCKAKATCPAIRSVVAQTVFESPVSTPGDFENLLPAETAKQSDDAWIGAVLAKADLIEDYLKAIRAEAERRMLDGKTVPGFKLVKGKRGNRAWGSPEAAEGMLKGMRLKTEEMYDLSLISPTSAEKLTTGATPAIGPRQWIKVKALITQSDGKPHVAPVSDKRQALDVKPLASEFDVVKTPETTESEYA